MTRKKAPPTTLDEIASAIVTNLESEESKTTDHRWIRGELYAAAKKILPHTKAFGEWCDSLPNIDEKSTISRMIQMVAIFNHATYQALRYSRAAIFCSNALNKYPEKRDKLIADAIANSWTVKQCREEANKCLVPGATVESEQEEANEAISGMVSTIREQAETIKTLQQGVSPFGDGADQVDISEASRRQLGRLAKMVKARNELLALYVAAHGKLPQHDEMLTIEDGPEPEENQPNPKQPEQAA